MRNALKVLRRDLARIAHAPKIWVILLGIIVLPSMYAWVNIVAFWDPYGNTAHIKVAVVNQDEGASSDLTGDINVGEQVVEQLKTNDQLGWQFLDEDEAMHAVKSGDSYAAIVIPRDFSRDLLTLTTGKFVQPELAYYTNEKANAIAPKITAVGASTVDTQINSTFVSTVAKTIAEKVSQAGTEAGDRLLDSRNNTVTAIAEAISKVEIARSGLTNLKMGLASGTGAVGDAKSALQAVDSTIGEAKTAVVGAQELVNEVQQDLVTFTDTVTSAYSSGVASLSAASAKLHQTVAKVSIAAGKAETAIGAAERDVQSVMDANSLMATRLSDLAVGLPPGDPVRAQLEQAVSDLQTQSSHDQVLLDTLKTAQNEISTIVDQITTIAGTMTQAVETAESTAAGLRNVLTGTLPSLNKAMATVSASAGAFASALDSQRVLVGEAVLLLEGLEAQLVQTQSVLDSLDANLTAVQSDLANLQTDLTALSAADIWNKVSAFTSLNPDKIAEFMTGPVQVHEIDLYPVPAYGSAMAPLFTNLSLWIAGFVLLVLFKFEVDTAGVPGLTVRQAYFGRWMLFAVMNVMQSLLVSIGNLVIGVQSVNPVAFVATSVFIGLVYLSIIYSLAASFGYIGKGLVILLVIMQIPGASGIYPIEMMPDFFRTLYPLFPFTYGIDAMREVIGGFYDGYYWRNLSVLLVYAALAFVLGILLRQRLGNFSRLFNRKLDDTDLFLSENVQILGSRRRLTQIVQALTDRERFRTATEKHARWLDRNHRTVMRASLIVGFVGSLVLFAIGNLNPDSKATVLGLWGLLCLLVIAVIVAIEYINQNIMYAAKVGEMPDPELKKALADEEVATRSSAPLDLLLERGRDA